MMSPKRTKFRKGFKGRISGESKAGFTLNFGQFGLKAVEPERISARPTDQGIVATKTINVVIAGQCVDGVVARRAGQIVVAWRR